jgi:hypothetical protein
MDRKNCHKLVGFNIALLLAKMRTIAIPIKPQPKFFKSFGKAKIANIPKVRNKIDVSAAIPLQ